MAQAHLIQASSQRGFGNGPRPASLYICVVASSVLLNLPMLARFGLEVAGALRGQVLFIWPPEKACATGWLCSVATSLIRSCLASSAVKQ